MRPQHNDYVLFYLQPLFCSLNLIPSKPVISQPDAVLKPY